MFQIKFVQADFIKVNFALEKLVSMATLERDEMSRRCADEFHYLLLYNLNHQTFAASYAPLNPRYAAWRHSTGNFWKLEGDLMRNIVKRRSGRPRGWAVGVNDAKDSGGKSWFGKDDKGPPKSIGMYAIVNEFGGDYGPGGHHPGRPLFRPTRLEFEKDGWPKEAMRTLKKLMYTWS